MVARADFVVGTGEAWVLGESPVAEGEGTEVDRGKAVAACREDIAAGSGGARGAIDDGEVAVRAVVGEDPSRWVVAIEGSDIPPAYLASIRYETVA